jgi:hypothetical protein
VSIMSQPTQPTTNLGTICDLVGNPGPWLVRMVWESATTYYLVAHNTATRRTTYCTWERVPSITKVLYTVQE